MQLQAAQALAFVSLRAHRSCFFGAHVYQHRQVRFWQGAVKTWHDRPIEESFVLGDARATTTWREKPRVYFESVRRMLHQENATRAGQTWLLPNVGVPPFYPKSDRLPLQ